VEVGMEGKSSKVDIYGSVFRLITPVLITIALFILTMIRNDVGELKAHFTNHLSDHKTFEVKLENRMTCLETIMRIRTGNYKSGKNIIEE
jgi:hypothetical protein